jgi:WD40 repeat protein/tRNA A-37 threonylcarbamoyl transferase component Bud32/tetratricopeptide (TPR) repeat protein
LDRIVAIKVPRAGQLSTAEDEDRFVREARNAAQLQHPGIVPVYEVGRGDQFPYIVSEFVDGITLADALTGRRFSFRESAHLIAQVASALVHAHAQGVVHRDLKPSNIMLTADNDPRVMDFGLAKRDAGEITMTMEGQVLGTPAYMSPEQASGQAHHVDGRSDIYTLGCVLYELISGELPFRGNQRMLLHQVLNDEPRAPRSLNDRIPRDLETICLKAMAKEPSRRYPTAQALSDDLARYMNGEPIAARPVGRFERSWRWVRRKPLVAGLSAAVFLALTSGALVSAYFAVQAESRAEEAIAEKLRADDKAAEAARASAQATEEAHKAIVEAEKATSVSQFLAGMFEISAPLKKGGVRFTGFGLGGKKGTSAGDLTAREVLDRGARKVVEQLQDQPAVRSALLETIGNVYIGLGLTEQADPLLTEALAIRRRLHPEPTLDTAMTLHSLAVLRTLQSRFDESKAAASEALEIRKKLLGDDHQDTVDTKFVLAFALGTQGNTLSKAEPLMREVLAWRRAHLGDKDPETVFGMLGLAGVLVRTGDPEKSAPLLSEATAVLLQNPETKPLGLAVTETIQSILMRRLKNWNSAADASSKSVEHFLEFESEVHPAFTLIFNTFLVSHLEAGRRDEIKDYCRAEFRKFGERTGPIRPITTICLDVFCEEAIANGNPDDLEEGERACRGVLDRSQDSAAAGPVMRRLATVLTAKARIACNQKEWNKARDLCSEPLEVVRDYIAICQRLEANEVARIPDPITPLGDLLRRVGRTEDAEAVYREGLTLASQHKLTELSMKLNKDLADLMEFEGKAREATSQYVVENMLAAANVGKDDVVYDLGSGDGRIVIEAARRYQCRAVGLEIDRDLVNQSQQRAREANVDKLVSIIVSDIFSAEFSDATVVTVFLHPAHLTRLLPKFETLKPGTRIVSRRFAIPDVPPEKTIVVENSETGAHDTVHVWTLPLPKQKLVRRIAWPGQHIFHTAFSPNGRFYLGGGDSDTLRVWEVEGGKQLVELPMPTGLFTPDSKQVLAHNSGKAFVLFDVTSGKEIRRWESSAVIFSMAIAPDGKQVISGHLDNVLRLWDFATGQEIHKFEGHSSPASAVFSPDGRQILSASSDTTIRLWDRGTGNLLRTFQGFAGAAPLVGHDLIIRATFLPDGRQIAGYVWGQDKSLLVWDGTTGELLKKLDLGVDLYKDLAVSPDGRWLLAAYEDRTVRLSDFTTGEEVRRFEMADVIAPRALTFSPDGRFAVSGSFRGWLSLWQLDN